jgi:pimeloyl-ACP methyl ester carboxylesterase
MRLQRRQLLLLSLAAAALVSAGVATSAYTQHIRAARARVRGRSRVFESRFGDMEYAEAGEGPPCVMIHGTGGGFDQGLAFARRLSTAGWRVIAPSRFGYLRSVNPSDPSLHNQALAVVDLMDHLGIERAPILGGSAGALTALQFAIDHPGRCSALAAVVPASHVPGRPPPRPNAVGAAIMKYGLRSDFLFWLALALAPDAMTRSLLATDPRLVHAAAPEEQARVRAILDAIQPVSLRAGGFVNDAAQAGAPQPMPLERISAPTLAISCEDDLFGTAAAARHIAASVRGAELVIYPEGGHVWVGHDHELWSRIDSFLRRE